YAAHGVDGRCRHAHSSGDRLSAGLLHGALCLISAERTALFSGLTSSLVKLSRACLYLEDYPRSRWHYQLVRQWPRPELAAEWYSGDPGHWRPVLVLLISWYVHRLRLYLAALHDPAH